MLLFQSKVRVLFAFLKPLANKQTKDAISTAYLQRQELGYLNSLLYQSRDNHNYQEICDNVKSVLPPIKSISKLTDLKDYSRISYKLDLKLDQQIVQQLFTLILQDQFGNFILKDKLIHHLIESIKLNSLDNTTKQLLSQCKLKQSEIQLIYIEQYIKKLESRILIKNTQNSNNFIKRDLQTILKNDELTYQDKIDILKIITQDKIINNKNILEQYFQNPSIEELILILPQIQFINLKDKYSNILEQYFDSLKIQPQEQGKVLGKINQIIAKNPEFFKMKQFNLQNILDQIVISDLLESQLNQFLYIMLYSNNIKLYNKFENSICEYIIKKQSINMMQMVAYFVHLTQIWRSIGNYSEELFKYICQYFIKNIEKCDGNQLFLIAKSLRLCKNIEETKILENIIENKIKEGILNQNHDALINYVANKIKVSQVLFMPEITNTVNVTQQNFSEWCHLLLQIASIRDLDQSLQKYFNDIHNQFRDKIKPNQLFYYFAAQFYCNIHDQQYFIQKIKSIRPFILFRILHFIGQSRTQHYNLLIEAIQNQIKQNANYLNHEFKQIDKGLLSFSLFTASLFDDQIFYEYLTQYYSKEIHEFVNEILQSQQNFERRKQFSQSSVQQTTNQSLFQFFQALRNHQCLTNKISPYMDQLEIIIKQLSETPQTMPSQLEEKVESILKLKQIEYIKDYSQVLPFRLDFLLSKQKIGIDCNGCSHYINGVLRKSDRLKYQYFEKFEQIKVEVIQFHSVDIQEKIENILNQNNN